LPLALSSGVVSLSLLQLQRWEWSCSGGTGARGVGDKTRLPSVSTSTTFLVCQFASTLSLLNRGASWVHSAEHYKTMEGREKKDDTAVLIKIEDFPSKKKYMLFGMFGWLPEFVCIWFSKLTYIFSTHTLDGKNA
jgi:hypothetical protein